MRDFATILICTRNRPADLERAVRSALASTDVDFEVIVVDQSDDNESHERLGSIPHGGRLRYYRSRTKGVGSALREGARLARSAYILRTDDDCEVGPDWAAGMLDALVEHPDVGLVFSNVVGAPCDLRTGYIPASERDHDELITSVFGTIKHRGLGASAAYRREALFDVGGNDAALGAGSRFKASDDWDLELRMLLRNWRVLHITDVEVVHYGFRSFAEGRVHSRRDWHGIGAMFCKLIRAGHPSMAVLASRQFAMYAVLPPINDALHLRRPRGIGRVTAFCQGFTAALRAPIDRRTMRFVQPDVLIPVDGCGHVSGRQTSALPNVQEPIEGLTLP
jgi:GT2 family glycosyltransferase